MRTLDTSLTSRVAIVAAMAWAAPVLAQGGGQLPDPLDPQRAPDVIFVRSTDAAIEAMLDLAEVGAGDTVIDLGCGDGAIVIAAAKRGARAVGVDVDPARVAEALANVEAAGVQDRVTIIRNDIFDPELKIDDATVVMLYLLEHLNVRLMPRLRAELKPGARVVSNTFTMGPTWPPDKTVQAGFNQIYLWNIR